MKKHLIVISLFLVGIVACNQSQNHVESHRASSDSLFQNFEKRFIDSYWKQFPSAAISAGYFKYADVLKIPDQNALVDDDRFAMNYLDSLRRFPFDHLNENNKADLLILQNQLHSLIWYADTFKQQEWDPSVYNIGSDCYEIIHKSFAPLNERLIILAHHLQKTGDYYKTGVAMLRQPTREHTDLAIIQNTGSLEIFGSDLEDSLKASTLSEADKDSLLTNVKTAKDAINNYIEGLKKIMAERNYSFRSFRIGETLFNQKFKYDIVTDFTPKQMFDKAVEAKNHYHNEMFRLSNALWEKYFGTKQKPADTLQMISLMIDKISDRHLNPEQLFDTLRDQVIELQKFVVEKNLLSLDSSQHIVVRQMPAYMSGTSLASATSPGPYESHSDYYYNVSDLTSMPREKAISQLKEQNYYLLQVLSIHEAVPGHLIQLEYSNRSPSIVKSVFGNGAMVEGWAVYSERMMLENGWGNNAPEMWLMYYKWALRECTNVIVDYGLQCLNYSKEDVVKMLRNEAFQEDAQIEEKYHRATISEVQLCSYFTGSSEILALREAMKKKEGSHFNLKNFHEKFLSYGSAPVKYIAELMLKEN